MTEEQVLIGMLINAPKFVERVSSKIKPEYFLENAMGRLFEEIINGNTNPPLLAKRCNVSLSEIIQMQGVQILVTKELIDAYGYYVFEQHKKIEISQLLTQEPVDVEAIEQIQKQTFFEEIGRAHV